MRRSFLASRPVQQNRSVLHFYRVAKSYASSGHAAKAKGNLIAAGRYFALAAIEAIRASRMLSSRKPETVTNRMKLLAVAERYAALAQTYSPPERKHPHAEQN